MVPLRKALLQERRLRMEIEAAHERQTVELEAMKRIYAISTRFLHNGNIDELLSEVVEAAISITKADMGNVQLLDSDSGSLKIVASRGLNKHFLDVFNNVREGQSVCGTSLEKRKRVIVEDVTKSPIFENTPLLEVVLAAGALAVQSTPLFSRTGTLVGMLSTHYRTPRLPNERDIELLDLLALQAADIVEQLHAAQALSAANKVLAEFAGQLEQQDHLLNLARDFIIVTDYKQFENINFSKIIFILILCSSNYLMNHVFEF